MKTENTPETWVPVKGYEGLYEVSDLGRVKKLIGKGCRYERTMIPEVMKKGYLRIGFTKNGVKAKILVHRVVGLYFLPNPDNLDQINHKDEVKNNNVLSNLEWCTNIYNKNYGTGTMKQSRKMVNHPSCSQAVKQIDKEGNLINIFPSQTEASRRTGASQSSISQCIRGVIKTSNGYVWAKLEGQGCVKL